MKTRRSEGFSKLRGSWLLECESHFLYTLEVISKIMRVGTQEPLVNPRVIVSVTCKGLNRLPIVNCIFRNGWKTSNILFPSEDK